jgi:hypothetical protein
VPHSVLDGVKSGQLNTALDYLVVVKPMDFSYEAPAAKAGLRRSDPSPPQRHVGQHICWPHDSAAGLLATPSWPQQQASNAERPASWAELEKSPRQVGPASQSQSRPLGEYY